MLLSTELEFYKCDYKGKQSIECEMILLFSKICSLLSYLGKLTLIERISPVQKLNFAKILQLYLRKSLVIVNVQENCNHICAKTRLVKFVMSVHPCGGES